MKKLNVALVGLGFGLEFVAIYCKHPDIDKVYVVDKNEKLLNIAKERYSIPDERCFTDLQDVLDIPEIDAVHLVTPPATHAPFSVRVLNAGKHCGCTIPMGMSIQELNDIIAARKASGKNYNVYGNNDFPERVSSISRNFIRRVNFGRLRVHDLCTLSGYGRMAGILGRLPTTDAPNTRRCSLSDAHRPFFQTRFTQEVPEKSAKNWLTNTAARLHSNPHLFLFR